MHCCNPAEIGGGGPLTVGQVLPGIVHRQQADAVYVALIVPGMLDIRLNGDGDQVQAIYGPPAGDSDWQDKIEVGECE